MTSFASDVIMVKPVGFRFNTETAVSNSFQNNIEIANVEQLAIDEFTGLKNKLIEAGINVLELEPTDNHTPDAVFPNNWMSFIPGGKMVLYPMANENRRIERRSSFIETIKNHFNLDNLIDLTLAENGGVYLEGTGSMIINHDLKIIYASISIRTHAELLSSFASDLGYECISFEAVDLKGQAIYHTNVLMSLGNGFAVLCEECIPDVLERMMLKQHLIKHNYDIIPISYEQMNSFAGNVYQVKNKVGEHYLIMSSTAYNAFSDSQLSLIKQKSKILHSNISTIETLGGGSARCMITGVFL